MPLHVIRVAVPRATLAVLAGGAILVGCGRPAPTPETAARPDAPRIDDGRGLVAAMRAKYGGVWFRTASILQNNTFYSARGTETKSSWRQRISVPGRLRIDYLPATTRGGVLFDGSRVHVFDNGRAIDTRPGINVPLLLTADVYVLPVERSAHLLDSLGFALGTLHRDTWEGRPTYVVGAAAGDSTASQFWVDQEELTVRRIIQRERQGARELVSDVRFGQLREYGGFPVATEVVQFRDGRLVFREAYADVVVDQPIPDAIFDPAKWVAGVPR